MYTGYTQKFHDLSPVVGDNLYKMEKGAWFELITLTKRPLLCVVAAVAATTRSRSSASGSRSRTRQGRYCTTRAGAAD